MKKLICISISLIVVLSAFAFAFADGEVLVIDKITGEVLNQNSTTSSTNYERISESCIYNKTTKMYQFTTTGYEDTDFDCSVYDGMIVTDPVEIAASSKCNVTVYHDGEIVEREDYGTFTEPGKYAVRDEMKNVPIMSFTIVPRVTGQLYSYSVPGIFRIIGAYYNDEEILVNANNVDMSQDGKYEIRYKNIQTDLTYTLEVTIDHIAPDLEIIGVVDGIAHNAVTFGETEEGSTLVMSRDGEYLARSGELKTPGNYTIEYSDEAGNKNTYYFTIAVFFDAGAWVFVGIIVLILLLAGGYMLYSRKHMRTR